jgi:hypothetical protein
MLVGLLLSLRLDQAVCDGEAWLLSVGLAWCRADAEGPSPRPSEPLWECLHGTTS